MGGREGGALVRRGLTKLSKEATKKSLMWLFNEVLGDLRHNEEMATDEFSVDDLADKRRMRRKLKTYRGRLEKILENLDEEEGADERDSG